MQIGNCSKNFIVNKEQLYSALNNNEILDSSTLTELSDFVNTYPFFEIGWMLLLKNLQNVDSIKFQSELKRASIHISNRSKLYEFINVSVENKQSENIQPTEKHYEISNDYENDLEINISATQPIYTLSDTSINIDESKQQNFNDWLNYFDQKSQIDTKTENIVKAHKNNLIDAFLSQEQHIIKSQEDDNQSVVDDRSVKSVSENEDILTETLASIYVKQKQYTKAITILKKLSLKNPEKSIYFATRISELEKKLND